MPKKKQKGTDPAFVLNSTVRIHAIMALGEACHGLHKPVLPTPQLSRKGELQSKTDESWPDSQQRAWRVWPVRKQTTILPTYPSLSFYPNLGPQRRKIHKTTTNSGNCTRAVPWRRGWLQPLLGCAPHLIPEHDYRAGNVPYTLSQSAPPHPGLVLRSLTRN